VIPGKSQTREPLLAGKGDSRKQIIKCAHISINKISCLFVVYRFVGMVVVCLFGLFVCFFVLSCVVVFVVVVFQITNLLKIRAQ